MSLAPLTDHSTSAPSNTSTSTPATATATAAPSSEAATKLAEAIDDFLGDVEKKFKSISDEILIKLDDMAERCDRLEQEMLMRDSTSTSTPSIDTRSKSTLNTLKSSEDPAV